MTDACPFVLIEISWALVGYLKRSTKVQFFFVGAAGDS